ncbi:MAG: hypothetical protein R3321_12480, partial [Nitrososphaeraceae archaeon]|nr:hypothetical protein [Nitrososphaeraceae archaeon]
MNSNQQHIVQKLKDKKSYNHSISKCRILETHISWIILTGPFAYKIKKNIKFGKVLDFSNLRLRKICCEKEVLLNRPLCGEMYQTVVKIIQENSMYKIVELKQKGKPLEYAVKMLEIPQKFRMDNLVKFGKVDKTMMDNLSNILFKFHESALISNKITMFGHPDFMKEKINENFRTISIFYQMDSILEDRLKIFIENNLNLFYQRM